MNPWLWERPALRGAEATQGLCLGRGSRGSWRCLSNRGVTHCVPEAELQWEPRALPVLLGNLQALLLKKYTATPREQQPPFVGDRGLPCLQWCEKGDRALLFLMEGGYRGTLYPRLFWSFPQMDRSCVEAVWAVLRLEGRAQAILAQADTRKPVTLTSPALDVSVLAWPAVEVPK